MDPSVISYTLGGALGILYGLASYATYRMAMRADVKRFYLIFLGGMAIRIIAALVIFLIVLLTVSVVTGAFAGSFLAVLLVGLLVEVAVVYRRQRTNPDRSGVQP